MARKISSRLEDLNLSRDEVERLGNAFKKEEFRKLLLDYVQEINDPVNRKEYEDGIIELEKQRGVDVKFVHPEPQYVLKTCYNPGGEKVFVNICSNSLVGKPDSTPCLDSGAPGSNWCLPLIQAPPREDFDKSGALCTVYDVLFHPETHALSAKDRKFRNFVEETALNAVEETYSVKLDRNSIKRPRLKFKGVPRPTVIRTRRSETRIDKEDMDDDIFIKQFPYPCDMPPEKLKPVRQLKPMKMESKTENSMKENFITPKFSLKQSSDVDISNYEQNLLSHHGITVPERLVLVVDLPYIKSSSELDLDLEAQKVSLCSTGKRRYKLELKLPYPVDETKGTAKFDKDAGKLLVTMVVDRQKAVIKKPNTLEGDSGIESDLGGGRTSSGEEEEARVSECHPAAAAESDKVTEGGEKIVRQDWLSQLHNCSSARAENIHRRMSADKVMEEALDVDLKKKKLRDGPGEEESYSCVPEERADERRKLIENMECESVNEVSSNEPVEGGVNDASKDVIRPGIPYLMPAFSCSCTHEQGNSLVTFILNVKNVDPCSVKKGVTCIKSREGVEKTSLLGSDNGTSLPSENGSIRNEYRTVVAESWPAAISSVDTSDVASDLYSKREETNRPRNSCKENVSLEVAIACDGFKPDYGTNSSCSSSSPQNYETENDVLYGANSSVVDAECLSDHMKKSLVINDTKTESTSFVGGEFAADSKEMVCFFVTFSSIGAGYFPQNYSFCVSFPSSQWPNVDPEWSDSYPSVEVWDNNVEIQWRKPFSENDKLDMFDCLVGQDLAHLEAYNLPSFEDKDVESESFREPQPMKDMDKKKEAYDDNNESSQTNGSRCENEISEPTFTAEERRKMFKERTLSESSVESNPAKQAMKGILKRKGRARLGRSLSESSGGEEYGWMAPLLSLSSSVGSSPSLSDINRLSLGESLKEEEEEYDEEEDDDEEDGEKVKKIVRFSDVISQKTYRSNSSILGQRKKNQRKLRNKKRAAERRASESENSVDEGDTGTDKSDCNSDSSPPEKTEITVQPEQSSTKGKPKGSAKKKANGNKGKGKRVDPKASNSGGATASQQFELKSDLIFQLEL